MNMRWSLSALYDSFESSEFKSDMKKCDEIISKINEWAIKELSSSENPKQMIEQYLNSHMDFFMAFEKLYLFSSLTLSVEAKNQTALRCMESLEEKVTNLTVSDVKFQKWLTFVNNLDDVITSSKLVEEHRFYIKELLQKNKYLLSENEEAVIARMKNTGSNAWSKLQDFLTSTLLVDINIDGENKQLPLPNVRNLAHDNRAEIRKAAYEAELASYKKIENSSAACLNGIKGEAITLCSMRGFKSPLDQVLHSSRMDEETLNVLLSAMRESLPSFRKYLKKKAELLGHKNGLPFYDLFAPIGKANMKFTYEEARDFVVKNFKTFSCRLAETAKHAFDNNWIDAEIREDKRGGAFCSTLHSIKQFRILSNFIGSFGDVGTLAHELGHGYHDTCLFDESFFNINVPMPLAETASIFCETIIADAALKTANNEEAVTILESSLQDSTQVIVDILSRYIFEAEVFEKRRNGSLSVNELNEIMLKAQRQTYGDGLDENLLHQSMWVCKPHYYSADEGYYNFPYAFGLLFGKGLYAEFLKRGDEFVKEYDKMLSVTGKNTIHEVAAMMNIDVHSIDFWRSSLKLIENDIEKFISLC